MNLKTNLLFIALLLLSIVVQCVLGNFPFAFFAFPLDVLLALLWIGGMVYMYKEKRFSQVVRLWLSPQCTYWTLGWLLAGCLIIGLFPQLSVQETAEKSGIFFRLGCYNFMSSWIFVMGLFGLLTHLGMITLKRGFLPGRNRWRFVLNHAGLWLALFAGFIGSAEEQTLRIPVFRDLPNNEAFTEKGTKVVAADRFYRGALSQWKSASFFCGGIGRRTAGSPGGKSSLCGKLGRRLLSDIL